MNLDQYFAVNAVLKNDFSDIITDEAQNFLDDIDTNSHDQLPQVMISNFQITTTS